MLYRCHTPSCPLYKNYGGRGIYVCDEWRESFENFYNWAVSEGGYVDGLTIERINVDEGYYPSNCTFADRHAQSRNKTNSRMITLEGVTKNWIDWCRYYDIPESTVRNRINRGMSVKEALTKPVKEVKFSKHTKVSIGGEVLSIEVWCRKYNIKIDSVRYLVVYKNTPCDKAIIQLTHNKGCK